MLPDRPEFQPRPLEFPVIAVGASAGGLQAFEDFLRGLDPDWPAAYVLVQHLDPTHDSILATLLRRHTALDVVEIEDGMALAAGRVHVIPSAAALSIESGTLTLSEFEAARGFRRPIDDFFQSLALDQGSNAAGVVLSGTGGDGTVGIRAIKEAAGIAVIQDPAEARYDGMPSSAIATGRVDFVELARKMGDTLKRYFSAPERLTDAADYDRDAFMHRVMGALRGQTGHDFGHYKSPTLIRRIQRRMQVLDIVAPNDYAERLEGDAREARELFRDLLINVTSFFRDPETFDKLRTEVIPAILNHLDRDRTVRVWCPGCSSGEEPYSLAILFAEALERMEQPPLVQIFATDIDEDMLKRARAGIYRQSVVADLPPELLERYFTLQDGQYQVVQGLRDMVRFSSHSLIKDPPFSRLDLLCCRNLLIYFENRLQERVMPLFHYALRPDGWLVLGSAENIGGRDDLFETVRREERIYRRKPSTTSRFVMPLTTHPRDHVVPSERRRSASVARDERAARSEQVTRRMMERYAPPHVVVNDSGQVIHVSARTAPFIEMAPGRPTTDLLALTPPALRSVLRGIMAAMRERRRRIVRRGIELELLDDTLSVDVTADPINATETMIVFRERARRDFDAEDADAEIADFSTEERIQELQDELGDVQDELRSAVEELETSNEELKSSNEEMMSMNEELQSGNEELSTVNEELKSKLDELAVANADLTNFLSSTGVATIFLDNHRRVRTFTPEARTIFRLSDLDHGRPLQEVRTEIDPHLLEHVLDEVIDDGQENSHAVELEDGRRLTFRALPYYGLDGKPDGAVLLFEDVTLLLEAQARTGVFEREAADRLREVELVYKNAPVGMALVDREQRYKRINDSLAEYNGIPVKAHLGRTISEVLPHIGPKLAPAIDRVFDTGIALREFEFTSGSPQDPDVTEIFQLDLYPVLSASGKVVSVGIIVRRITEMKRLERQQRALMGELQHRVKNTLATVQAIIAQTVRSDKDREDLAETLQSRVSALAGTHNLLTRSDWRGVSLAEIVGQELKPYARDDQVVLAGKEVQLSTKAALTITMVVHELATNAVKYGALSDDDGTLKVEWSLDDERFRLRWAEHSETPVERPKQRGFGLRFIERSIRHDLGGTVSVDWAGGNDGNFAVTADVPAAVVSAEPDTETR